MFGRKRRKEYDAESGTFKPETSRRENEKEMYNEKYKNSYRKERESHIRGKAREKAKRYATRPTMSESLLQGGASLFTPRSESRGRKNKRKKPLLFEGGSIFG
jgi:hypothetical protein